MFKWLKKKDQLAEEKILKTVQYEFKNPQPIADYFKVTTGINFEDQMPILNSKLTSFCKLRKIASFESCLTQLKNNKELNQELNNYLTTNETYFYREFGQIEALVDKVRIEKKLANILCIPCSTGEEPYSIAIALLEAGVDRNKFNIVGIDINTEAIERALEGIYNKRDVSRMPSDLIEKYFIPNNDKYFIKEKIKSMVKFRSYNLFNEDIAELGRFDFIVSRNMFIYFDLETKKRAALILKKILKSPEGLIFYGHADLY
ncbi:MAG: chemotaxis protein methyltransferase CheR [Candidatus Azotimanducaceae bacterium]|jgi:chemotaxis protein methyltransferase CheR